MDMSQAFRIPQGDETVKVELTLKEVMALAGQKFHYNHDVFVSARKKLNQLLDEKSTEDTHALH
jgi:hypothetical protein